MAGERDSCVFCTRAGQPAALFETASLYAMPDKFPLCPGHILLISTAHLPCYGAASTAMTREVDEATAHVGAFLTTCYPLGCPILIWENGVAGQTVSHAHLHLLPLPLGDLPPALAGEADATPIAGWAAVRDRFARRGGYRYLAYGGARWLLPGQGAVIGRVQGLIAQATGLRRAADDWVKTTTSADVAEVGRRWAAWAATRARIGPD